MVSLPEGHRHFRTSGGKAARTYSSRAFVSPRPLQAEPLNRLADYLHASVQLLERHKLISAMGNPNVSRPKHNRLRAKLDHLRRFRAERDSACPLPCAFLQ